MLITGDASSKEAAEFIIKVQIEVRAHLTADQFFSAGNEQKLARSELFRVLRVMTSGSSNERIQDGDLFDTFYQKFYSTRVVNDHDDDVHLEIMKAALIDMQVNSADLLKLIAEEPSTIANH